MVNPEKIFFSEACCPFIIMCYLQMYHPVAGNQEPDVVYMREYRRGELTKETKLRGKDYDYLRREVKRDQRARRVEKRQAAKVGSCCQQNTSMDDSIP